MLRALAVRRWARPVATVALAAAALGTVFTGLRVVTHTGGPSAFIEAGDAATNPTTVAGGIDVTRRIGYDGQYFYRLALDPLTTRRTAFGITFDSPSYRQQRIIYPTLAWVVSAGGQPRAVVWMLIALNVGAMAALGAIGAQLARDHGRNPWWGLVLALGPAFAVSLARDTSELVAMAFVAGGLLALRRRHWVAAILLTLAVLTRETTLIVPIGLGMAWLWERRPGSTTRSVPFGAFALPGVTFIGWQAFLQHRWGDLPAPSGSRYNVGLPLTGLVDSIRHNMMGLADLVQRGNYHIGTWLTLANIGLAILAVVFIAFCVASVRRSEATTAEKIAFGVTVAAATLLAWQFHEGFLRAAAEVFTLGVIVLLGRTGRWSDTALRGVAGAWAGVALAYALVI